VKRGGKRRPKIQEFPKAQSVMSAICGKKRSTKLARGGSNHGLLKARKKSEHKTR